MFPRHRPQRLVWRCRNFPKQDQMNRPINFRFGTMAKIFSAACLLIILLGGTPVNINAQTVCTHYVATDGNDANTGSLIGAPWRTIQKSANTVEAGDIVCVRAGTYNETVGINVSGSSADGYVVFQNYPGEQVILDGGSSIVPSGWGAMIHIRNGEYIIVKGFEIQNYKTSLVDHVPMGIFVDGTGNHIELRDNIIHDIETNFGGANGGDAHGIAVYGTSGVESISEIIIDNNQVYDLKLGSSESLAVNGNVDQFQVTNNVVHDNNNIGIVAIGFEGTAPANDQARNGIVSGNVVYNINSFGNPAYGNERSAGCIYVDGGTHIVVENNIVHHCNVGVELASEHRGKSTSYVTLRNNLIYNSTQAGIGIGGYDTLRGNTENCIIVNNTLHNNTTQGDWGAELYVQYNPRNNVIQNNIFSNPGGNFVESWSTVMSNNSVNYNLFFSAAGVTNGNWTWKNIAYSTFSVYQQGSGNDANSLIGVDPLFTEVNNGNFQPGAGSPGIDAGNNATCAPADQNGITRPQGAHCDIGAFEHVDIIPPSVLSIIRVRPINPSTASVYFAITFSEHVTGVDMAGPAFDDFALTTSPGINDASVTGVSGSGASYTVTVNTGSGNGTIRLDVPDTATIDDLAGNPLGSLPFTSGSIYTLTTTAFSSTAANDGWTLESSEYSSRANARNNSGSLLVGDDARNKQYRSLLYFDTASLPDNAVISSITVKVMQESFTIPNPFTTHGALLADMAKGFFGKSALENTDFQAQGAPRFNVGSFSPVSGDWYQLVLSPANFKFINLNGVTQFRLRFAKDDNNNKVADYISFYSGDDPTNPPQLIVEYTTP
jgi:hypothetical protein